MNGKIVIAFASGALIASGIVYVAVKPAPPPKPAKLAVVTPKPPKVAVATPAPVAPAAPVPGAPAAPISATRVGAASARVAVVVEPVRAPLREKPSPLSPPRREEPLIARNENPPLAQPAPAPPVDTPPIPSAPAPPAEPQPVTPGPVPSTPPSPQPVPTPESAPQAPPPESPPAESVQASAPAPERVPHTVTIAAGTTLPVRIGETISSAHNQAGDSFLATLDQPLVVDGFIIAERGARVEGRVTDANQAGRGRGVSHLSIALVRLATSDGQNIRIQTGPYQKEGDNSAGTDAAKIGGGAAIGAIIGAIAGGGKGAAIGAGVGGAAGAGDVLLTRAKPAEIRVETRLTFRIQDPVIITERLD